MNAGQVVCTDKRTYSNSDELLSVVCIASANGFIHSDTDVGLVDILL